MIELAAEEGETRVGPRRLGDEARRQFRIFAARHQMTRFNAALHLVEKGHRHVGEFAFEPLVRCLVQVLMQPKRRKAGAEGELECLQTALLHS